MANPQLLRDRDIRCELHSWLRTIHDVGTDTAIVDELKLLRPSARVDVAVINGEMAGFEIKSDVDVLSRLPRQIDAFGAVFDKVTLVTTATHLKKARKIVPTWWGIMTVGRAHLLVERRKPKRNPTRKIDSLLHLHSRAELITLLRAGKVDGSFSNYRRAELVGLAKAKIHEATLRDFSRGILRSRFRTTG